MPEYNVETRLYSGTLANFGYFCLLCLNTTLFFRCSGTSAWRLSVNTARETESQVHRKPMFNVQCIIEMVIL